MASRKARFRVAGKLDSAGPTVEGTLTIDRDSGVVEVRRLRSRRVFLSTLSALADVVVWKTLFKERMDRAKAKKAKRGRRRG